MNGTTGTTDDFAGSGGSTGAAFAAEIGDPAGAAFHHAPAAMFVADRTGAILLTNRAFAHLTGYRSAEPPRGPWPDLLADSDVERGWELHRLALSGPHESPHRSLRLTGSDGTAHHVVVEPRPLAGGDGAQPAGIVVMCRGPMRDEETLRAITELRTENSDTALWTLDLRTGELGELFGPSPLGRLLAGESRTLEECLARVHRDDIARLRDAMEASYQGRDYEQRFRMFDQVGDERWLHARARYLEGGTPRLVGIIDDVTEHVQLVRRLADRRRIEAAQGRQVNELAAKLVSATTVDEVTGLLTEEFVPIFGGSTAAVVLLQDGVLRAVSSSTQPNGTLQMIDGRDATDTSFPMGAVLQDRQPRFFESRAEVLERFPAVQELLHRTNAQSWATVPIFGDRRIALGVWQVAWTQPHHATPDERALMLTLAGLAGQALQRVSRQQAELELADAMQRRMLPPQLPDFPGLDVATRYLPSRAGWRVCGDFYDAIQLPNRRIGLVVGDVQGHGVEAAAAMGQIRVAFRAYATNQSDPGVVLAETNRLLTETGEIVFATCGYLVLDLDSGEMQAAWAGQPPAIIATTEGFEVWGPETGPPVGVDGESKYPVTTRRLAPGETLLMCSDGLVESSEVRMDDGLERVGQALRSMATDVHAAATSLADLAPAGRGDDIAILIARMPEDAFGG
ncbi:PAS domain S-box-containing protein [Spinactinospora alkalitolerans]|uniref:PAS domain S-box-containing protein n=1 Tax=Spinactinospora alkalitolerans TaxID=687207 RepID=A0A852TQ72_9ACTN|nr:SpoIIE family protein phosphatase [Spinactinospora alkalitolerans]NYE46536.1 PAS domain S-box-containing protein [Spinactinospora alkalitolerans]